MKKIVLTALFALSSVAGAQTTSATNTSTDKSFYQKLKDSPFGMSFYLSAEARADAERRGKYDGVSSTNIVTAKYKLTDKDSVAWANRYTYSNNSDTRANQAWARSVLRYSRGGILNQNDHGINLSGSIDFRYLPENDTRRAVNRYGLIRPKLGASRSFDNGFSLASSLYFAQRILRESAQAGSGFNYWYLVTIQSYSATDKLGFSLVQEWFHSDVTNDGEPDLDGNTINDFTDMIMTAEVSYSFTSQLAGAFYVTSEAFVNHDGKSFREGWLENPGVGVYATISAF